MLHLLVRIIFSVITLSLIQCSHLKGIQLKSSLPILPSKTLKLSKNAVHLAPLDQQVHQHLHQFQVAQQLSSPQPLVSSVATLLPSSSSSIVSSTSTGGTSVTSPLVSSTPPSSLRSVVTTVSPLLTSALLSTSTASTPYTVSKASRAVQPAKPTNTVDWDIIYKVMSRFTDLSNISQGIKRSISGASGSSSSSLPSLSSIFYGLSMAAGLALGVTMSDSPLLLSFLNRVDHRFATRSSNRFYHQDNQPPPDFIHHITNPPMSTSSSSSSPATSPSSSSSSSGSSNSYLGSFDNMITSESRFPSGPIIQRNVAPSKDGKDHYHHVVHYHIPYPMSVGALDTMKSSAGNGAWYPGSDGVNHRNDLSNHQPSSGGSKMSMLSNYLGPLFNHNSHLNMANSLKESLASRISSLPFIGSHSGTHATSSLSSDYYNGNKAPYESSLNPKPTDSSSSSDRFSFNYPSPWLNREGNQTQYAQASSFNSNPSMNVNYPIGSYDFANAFPGFGEMTDTSDPGFRRNDQYRVFSDSEYFKSLNQPHGSNNQSNASRKFSHKKTNNSRKVRPKKPTMDELIFTGNSQVSSSSNGNLVDQSSTTPPFSTSSSSSTLPDLLGVSES